MKRRVIAYGVFGALIGLGISAGFPIALERGMVARGLSRVGVTRQFPFNVVLIQNPLLMRPMVGSDGLWLHQYLTAPGVEAYQVIRSDVPEWGDKIDDHPVAIGESQNPPRWVKLPGPHCVSVKTEGYGWPIPSHLRTVHCFEPTPFPDFLYVDFDISITACSLAVESDLRVWPPGLVGNTAIFGAAIALALFSVDASIGAVRYTRRRARGRCGACGYSVAGLTSPICPECGRTISALRRESHRG